MVDWREIDGWLEEDEARALQTLLEGKGQNDFWIEIGSWKGKSSAVMAETGVKGFCIDWFRGSPEHGEAVNTFEEFQKNTLGLNLTPIIGRSEEVYRQIPIGACLLFIDGEHSYEAVKRDYELYSPKVLPDGYIVFHDAAPYNGRNHAWPDVEKFVDKLKQRTGAKSTTVNRMVIFKNEDLSHSPI